MTTLQSDFAITDFEKCLSLGAEKLDCLYRIGLAHYYAGRYEQAMETFVGCMPLCNDEMGIAVLYWHTLSAVRAETSQSGRFLAKLCIPRYVERPKLLHIMRSVYGGAKEP